MARTMNDPMPVEIGYVEMPAIVVETGQMGHIWIAGSLTTCDGDLEEQEKY